MPRGTWVEAQQGYSQTSRRIVLLLGVALLVSHWSALPAVSQSAPETPNGLAQAARRAALPSLHEQLGRLDQELQVRLIQLHQDSAPATENDLRVQAERFRRRLEALELQAHGVLSVDEADAFSHKLHALRSLVLDLARGGASASLASALPSSNPRPQRSIGRNGDAQDRAQSNDVCAGATVVDFGTFVGNTAGATNDGQASCGSSFSAPDVWFRFVAMQSGTISVDTLGSDYDTVLSVHTACPGTLENERTCNDDSFGLQSVVSFFASAGTEYLIRVSGFNDRTGSFRLSLGLGGGISGIVSDSRTGGPLGGVQVEIVDDRGFRVRVATTDSSGEFATGGLRAGEYFLVTGNFLGFVDELYDDIPCPGGRFSGCDPRTGTPVGVTSNATTTGLELALDPGASISGTVVDAATADPLDRVRVEVRGSDGFLAGSALTDDSGLYLAQGLVSGDYFVTAESSQFADELYDNLPCPGGPFEGCDPRSGTPIAVAVSATTTGIDFALNRLGAISGTVTDADTGEPIPGARVEIRSGFSFAGSTTTDGVGDYRVGGLTAGSYVATVEAFDFADELYDDLPCPGGFFSGCNPSDGTPIGVDALATTAGIDFSLKRLGSISGKVTDAVTGDPLVDARVNVWSSAGRFVRSAFADDKGKYRVGSLRAGTHFATTDSFSDYIDELYNDLPCPRGDCSPVTGTPIEVHLNANTPGIRFGLDLGGAISGTVTEATTGDPLASVEVEIWNDRGSGVDGARSDALGHYTVNGLLPGTYFATTDVSFSVDYADELYDDLPCPGGGFSGCDPITGSAIEVTLKTTTEGIDFALDPLGAVSGTVTETITGQPIRFARVQIWTAEGFFAGSESTDSAGQYTVRRLPAGTYFATTNTGSHVDELYDDLPCLGDGFSSCDPTLGTPIEVVLGTTTAGIDFALDGPGAISGTVIETATGQLGSSVRIHVWNAAGAFFRSSLTDAFGNYSVGGLPAGSYFVSTDSFSSELINELYDNLPCSGRGFPGCDPTMGTPVAVSLDSTTAGVDFTLDRLGSLSGFVTELEGGEPIPGVRVRVWNGENSVVGTGTTDSNGVYLINRLTAGRYYVTTQSSQGYLDELYDDIPCLGGSTDGCTPSKGTAVQVRNNTTTRNIHFTLESVDGDREGAIAGTVTHAASGAPLPGVSVDAWDAEGNLVASTVTRPSGAYVLRLAPGPGPYFVSTDNGLGLLDEVFNDVACPRGSAFAGRCDPRQGTPILRSTTGGVVASNVNFVLDAGSIFVSGFETGDLTSWSRVVGDLD